MLTANCASTLGKYLVNVAYDAKVPPQQGGDAGALLRLEAYLDTVSGTQPSAGLLHPMAFVFT